MRIKAVTQVCKDWGDRRYLARRKRSRIKCPIHSTVFVVLGSPK